MAQKHIIKTRTGEDVYPVTHIDCVVTNDGSKVATIDDAWKQLIIKRFEARCAEYAFKVGEFNKETQTFTLNELEGITFEEMIPILEVPMIDRMGTQEDGLGAWQGTRNVRTFFPIRASYQYGLQTSYMCNGNKALENVRMVYYYNNNEKPDNSVVAIANSREWLGGNPKLKRVLGYYKLPDNDAISTHFYGTITSINYADSPLEEIWLQNVHLNIPNFFSVCNNLKIDCWKYMVEYATNTTPIKIAVHNDVYTKLNDESNTEWYELNELAKEKQISFLTREMYEATPATMELKEEVEVINDDVNSKIMELEKQIQELKNIVNK